eukprot:3176843-Pleurochrysis_carterae.AAC.5
MRNKRQWRSHAQVQTLRWTHSRALSTSAQPNASSTATMHRRPRKNNRNCALSRQSAQAVLTHTHRHETTQPLLRSKARVLSHSRAPDTQPVCTSKREASVHV